MKEEERKQEIKKTTNETLNELDTTLKTSGHNFALLGLDWLEDQISIQWTKLLNKIKQKVEINKDEKEI